MLIKFIGKLLRKWREERGYSVKEVAKHCGKSESNLAKLERGEIKKPSLSLILNYLKAINVSYGEFFNRIERYEIEKLLDIKKKVEETKIEEGIETKVLKEGIHYSLGLVYPSKPLITYPEGLELKIKSYLLSLGYEKLTIEKYIRFSEDIFYGLLYRKDDNYFEEVNKKAKEENLSEIPLRKIAKMTYKDYQKILKRTKQAKPISEERMKKMIEGYLKYRKEWYEIEGRIRKFLCDNNVISYLIFNYLNKARRYYKLLKKNKIEKIKEVDEKAIKEGLEKKILEGIKEIVKEAIKK